MTKFSTSIAMWFGKTNDGDDEGGDASVTDGCQAFIGFTAGNIALVDRGDCSFVSKANRAVPSGAGRQVPQSGRTPVS